MAPAQATGQGVIGWDIGGAHLKAAAVVDGLVVAVVQEPCPLWQGLDRLEAAFTAALSRLPPVGTHAVTMTGELVDLFEGRAAGVAALSAAAAARLGDARIYAGSSGFLAWSDAAAAADAVASANWHATAAYAARRLGDALVVDIGSTTTDLIPVRAGRVAARGATDAARMAAGELVYTGATRTPLMAVADRAPVAGSWTGVMAEYFATMGDAGRLLDRVPESADQHPTADGRGKSVPESRLRLSRMVGRDVGELPDEAWIALAAWFAESQLRRIHDAALLVLSATGLPSDAPVLACGIGRPAIAELARRLGRPCRGFAEIVPMASAPDATADWAAHCAPAVAVALLAAS